MRRVFYISHPRLLASVLLLFFISGVLFPQTIIKEKVKVNPNTKTVSYQPPEFAPCGPWNTSQTDYYNPYQVIWNDNYFNIDPYQQWFNHQGNSYENYSLDSNHYYNVEITQGAAYCWIEKDVFDPITGYYIGDEILTEPLLNIRGAELIGAGPMVISYCNIWEKFYYPPHYYLRFVRDVPQGTEIIISIQDLTSGNPPIYYHTIVETPLITISNETDSDTLYHNSERYITLYGDVNDSYYNQYCWSCGGALPSSVKFTLEIIEGEEFGSLFDAETEQRGISFSNIGTYWGIGDLFETRFKYIADGIQPDSIQPGIVTIRCTPSVPAVNTVDISFPIGYSNYSDKILVEFTKPKLQPGESTQIILRKMNPDGTIENFPPYQAFEIGMLEGCDLGKIISDNQAGNYFYFAYQPFYFVADTNAVSGVAQIRVGLIEGGGGASKIVQTDTSTSNVDNRLLKSGRRNRFNKKLNSMKLSKANLPKVNASCSTSFIKEKDGSGDVVIGDDCSDFQCQNTSEPIDIKIQLDIVPPDYAGFDYCNNLVYPAVGLTRLLFDWDVIDPSKRGQLLVPFKIISDCYDTQKKSWRYNIVSKNKEENNNSYDRWDSFFLRIVSTICLNAYEESGNDFTYIENLSENELKNKIPREKVCEALQDFEYNRPYASDPLFEKELTEYEKKRNISAFRFCKILPADAKHEEVHKNNTESDILTLLDRKAPNGKKYFSAFKEFQLKCKDANEPKSAGDRIKEYYNNLLSNFIEDLRSLDDQRTNDPDNENDTQWSASVKEVIDNFIDKLISIYPEGGNCLIEEINRRDK